MSATDLFTSNDAARVAEAMSEVGGDLIAQIEEHLRQAMAGSDDATREYVADYRKLTAVLLTEACRSADDPTVTWPRWFALTPSQQHGDPQAMPEAIPAALEASAAQVALLAIPTFGSKDDSSKLGYAVALNLANQIRTLMGTDALSTPRTHAKSWLFEEEHSRARTAQPGDIEPANVLLAQRFQRRVLMYLSHDDTENPMARLMRVFDLSKSDLGALFGVRRQAIDGWRISGVPADRQEKVSSLLALCDLLERKLKDGRIPGVARREADAYGGKTMLQMIAEDRHNELLASVRESFNWATSA